jgi:hypothetical protein
MDKDEILKKLKELEAGLSPEEKLKLLQELNGIIGELNDSILEFNGAINKEIKIADARLTTDKAHEE